jgi:hypothetical protein
LGDRALAEGIWQRERGRALVKSKETKSFFISSVMTVFSLTCSDFFERNPIELSFHTVSGGYKVS